MKAPSDRRQATLGPHPRRRSTTKRGLAAVLLAMMFTACDSEAESYATPGQVVRAMADAGVECVGFEIGGEMGAPLDGRRSLIEGRGICSIDGEPVVIATFENAEDRADWVAVGKLLGPVAVGPNWVVTSPSEEVVTKIAEALGGTEAPERRN